MRRCCLLTWLLLSLLVSTGVCFEELRFFLSSEPKTFNPAEVADDSSETIRYLTGGVLLRLNRQTQKVEPELAQAWKVSRDGRTITFQLRTGIRFSDGTPFTARDVKYTMDQLMEPALHSPTGDAFRSSNGRISTTVTASDRVVITFPAPVAGADRLFDQVAIVSSQSRNREAAVLGPFFVSEYKPGAQVYLRKNPNYWKHDESGRQLPYLDAVRLEIQGNRDIEMLKFSRNEIHLINSMDADYFDRLSRVAPSKALDAGPSLDSEQMWFNQRLGAPIPAYKLEWFTSRNFRRAISFAIHRDDLCKVVYRNHASPALGPVSPANRVWFDTQLQPVRFDQQAALKLLQQDGFRLSGGVLRDRSGHVVEFSIMTNAGNRSREKMATMIQTDLRSLGISINVVTLDFASLIQRISDKFNYEAVLLGLVNVELDPNAQMNVWLSSSEEHQWNPKQSSPATPWESEIDRLMRAQASTLDEKIRKGIFDRVQEIVADQVPFIYLVNKDALVGVSPLVQGVKPVAVRPQSFWNIDRVSLAAEKASSVN
jgi:peptide/nickel transport system substrate-binding protein